MVKVYDLPQFAALTAAASQFKTDDKLHLRHLCGDAARCESLVATHTNETKGTKIVLDYSILVIYTFFYFLAPLDIIKY